MSVSDPLIKDIKGHQIFIFNCMISQVTGLVCLVAYFCFCKAKLQKLAEFRFFFNIISVRGTLVLIQALARNLIAGCVQELLKDSGSIEDNNFYLILLCQILEKIFNTGLITNHSTIYFNRTIDPFCWLAGVAREKDDLVTYTYINCVDNVRSRGDLRNNTAKFRYLIKNCLVKKCLHVPVAFLIRTNKLPIFYKPNSILGDEILAEIFLSVLFQLGKFKFCLDLENCSFLDMSWYIPEILKFELVPCEALGISVSFSNDRAVIVNIQSTGVAAETEKIHMGDILDKLNGTQITSSSKGKLCSILRHTRAKPVNLTIIKSYHQESQEFFGPILRLYKDLKLDIDQIKAQYRKTETEENSITNKKSYGFEATYLGFIFVGEDGSVKQIEKAIKTFLSNDHQSKITKTNRRILFEIGEIGVRLRDPDTNQVILQHTYMAISSCGSNNLFNHHFGYVASEETCDKATTFNCYIFNSGNTEEIATILQSIGQGFHRTHFAV